MVTVEYLSELLQQGVAPAEVTVDQQVLRLKHGGFLRGWFYQSPCSTIISVELAMTQEVRAKGILSPGGVTLPERARANSWRSTHHWVTCTVRHPLQLVEGAGAFTASSIWIAGVRIRGSPSISPRSTP